VIRLLKTMMPIERAKMRLRVVVGNKEGKKMKERLNEAHLVSEFQYEDWGTIYSFECEVDPGHFRPIESIVSEVGRGTGSVQVLDLSVQQDVDVAWE
jgi:ribosome maturation protein SDO1